MRHSKTVTHERDPSTQNLPHSFLTPISIIICSRIVSTTSSDVYGLSFQDCTGRIRYLATLTAPHVRPQHPPPAPGRLLTDPPRRTALEFLISFHGSAPASLFCVHSGGLLMCMHYPSIWIDPRSNPMGWGSRRGIFIAPIHEGLVGQTGVIFSTRICMLREAIFF